MLILNLSRLSERDIEDTVILNCTSLGSVASVAVLTPGVGTLRAYALVTMKSEDESEAVEELLGDGRIGQMVVIRLEQEERQIPSSLLRNALGHH